MAETITVDNSPTALQGLGRMAPWRQVVLLVGLAGAVALGGWLAMWSQQPNSSVLYSGLEARDTSEIATALKQAGIPHQANLDVGTITVPADRVKEARMLLLESGLPKANAEGFASLKDTNTFGMSTEMIQAQYRRALEVELGQTISALGNVRAARVHLGLPRQSAFLKRNRDPSASVLVQTARGRMLEDGQAETIAYMVAAAIPNLEPGQVRVADSMGRLLTRDDAPGAVSRHQLDYTRQLEANYTRRIEDLLSPLVGLDAVNAEVVADIDLAYTEEATERFQPDGVVRSEQLSEDRADGDGAGGIPGALTNQPPGAGAAPEDATGGFDARGENAGGQGSRRSKTTRNYEIDRKVSSRRKPSGEILRLSAAVVVDHRREVAEDGTVTLVARTPEEIASYTALVRDAIGFDAERGDTVRVVNQPFTLPPPIEPPPEVPLWQQPWVWDIARQAGGVLLVLFLAFGVLRPVMRNLVAREVAERELAQATTARVAGGEEGAEGGENPALGGPDGLPQIDAPADETELEAIRALVNNDPRRVANAMRTWVNDG